MQGARRSTRRLLPSDTGILRNGSTAISTSHGTPNKVFRQSAQFRILCFLAEKLLNALATTLESGRGEG
jgi:hypothetical protein